MGPREPLAADRFLRVTRTCLIPLDELEWRFSSSGGPGGQHANTSNTRAEVRFDIEQSTSLGPHQRARLSAKFGPVARVVVSDRRSQAQNRELALERLRARLAAALRVDRTRVATKPTTAAKRARLDDKRRKSQRKAGRRRVGSDDE